MHLYTWGPGFHSRDRIYPLNPFTNNDISVATQSMRIFPSWLIAFWQRVFWLSLALQFTVCWNINTGLWRKNSIFTRKVSGVLYLCKCNVQKSEILTNIDVYSYRRPHRRASCSAGVIFSSTCSLILSVQLAVISSYGYQPISILCCVFQLNCVLHLNCVLNCCVLHLNCVLHCCVLHFNCVLHLTCVLRLSM
jgi:hypothetical protein